MATVPVDPAIQRLLNDKLYDKRKQGALEYEPLISIIRQFHSDAPADKSKSRLEKVIRDAVSKNDDSRVKSIVDHLCHEYAYAVHQPHARNGGLIGLAAASIALGSVRFVHLVSRAVLDIVS